MLPGPMNDQKVGEALDLPAGIIMSAGKTIIIVRLCSMRFFGLQVWKYLKNGVSSSTPDHIEIEANLDPVIVKKKKS